MSRFLIIWFICLYATGLDAGPRPPKVSSSDGKIVGGQDTDISAAPYQVSMQYRNRHICGGSIINSRYIITAAHCVDQLNSRDLSIRAGSNYHMTGGEVHRVRRATPHPNYSRTTTNNDIAVLELETPIKPSSGAMAIGLARTEPRPGDQVFISGWGSTREGGPASRNLQSVIVPAISRETCQRMYMRYNTVTDKMWCAGYQEGGRDACQGDSGGPAVVNGRLAGVVSWGAGCARRNSPGVYTNVVRYSAWIAEQTGQKRRRKAERKS